MSVVWRAAEKLRWLRATSRQFGHRILHLFVTVEHQTRKIHNTGMQIQIQILIQLQYLPSWVPWRGNCLPPFPHNALPSIPRAEISLSTILQFHGVHFSIFVYLFILNISLSICICICLARSVEYPHGWDYAWDNSWISNLDTPLPLSTADIEIYSSGLGLFRLCPLNIKTNRYTIQRREQLQDLGYFKVSPDICTYKDDEKNTRDAPLLRTVQCTYISLASSIVTGHRRCDPGSSDLPFPCLPNTQHSLPL